MLSELDVDGGALDGGRDRAAVPDAAVEQDLPFGSAKGSRRRRGLADAAGSDGDELAQDGPTVLRGFRRLLWFWGEYYLRGGRDRLSLEFSTHVKFWAWKRVVRLLCADDGSPTALVDVPLRLPRSPYDVVVAPASRQQ